MTAERDTTDLQYVGFWPRVGASLIDTGLVLILIVPLMLGAVGPSYWTDTRMIKGVAGFVIEWLLPALAVMAFWIALGATPGKMAISARIVDAATGRPASRGQLVTRYVGYFVSTFPLFIGLLWVAWDGKKQGWHDKLAGTVVVRPAFRGPEPVRFDEARSGRNSDGPSWMG